jgi:HK97 family phage prohead protease
MDLVRFAATAAVEGNTLTGIAHAFGARAKVGNHYEQFRPGAFDEALRGSDVRAFVQHDPGKLLGRQGNNTVRLAAEADGLHYAIDLPDTSYANDLKALVARGDLNEMSFSFVPGNYTWSKAEDGAQVRTHTNVRELVDVSPVAIPAFEGTQLELRSRSFGESTRSQAARARARVQKGNR